MTVPVGSMPPPMAPMGTTPPSASHMRRKPSSSAGTGSPSAHHAEPAAGPALPPDFINMATGIPPAAGYYMHSPHAAPPGSYVASSHSSHSSPRVPQRHGSHAGHDGYGPMPPSPQVSRASTYHPGATHTPGRRVEVPYGYNPPSFNRGGTWG
jgi:hypothetical protein